MIVGIDLGTTNSLIGAMDSGFPILFAEATGGRLTPSAVWFRSQGDPVVGGEALAHREESVLSVKRLMGRQKSAGPQGQTPEEISALILKKLKADAEKALGVPVTRAVITVPAYFNDSQRAATKRAGELAGFTVERLLAEPTAAALAYGLDKLTEKAKVAVYDLGGGTFDISILELSEGVFHVLSTNGDTQLGGDDLDAAIAANWAFPWRKRPRSKKTLPLTTFRLPIFPTCAVPSLSAPARCACVPSTTRISPWGISMK